MVKGEIITLGTAAAVIGGAYKFSEFLVKAKKVRDVGPSNAVYVRMIGRVRADLDEVKRLLSVREVHDVLEANPDKSKWVYGVMRDVRGALENITPHTERVAGDIDDGRRVGVRHRVYWLLSEKEKLENREKELNIAHASLGAALDYLAPLEPTEEPQKPKSSKKDTHVDVEVDIKHDSHGHAPQQQQHTTERVEREVWVDHNPGPRRVEEHRDVWVERDRHHGPPQQVHYEEHRDVYVDERDQRGPPRYEERDIHIERTRGPDPRDARYDAQYDERYEQHDHYEQRRPFPEPLGRRPESFEDRLPERDSWMQSSVRPHARAAQYGPYGEYAEYGAPQPVGAAHYQRRFQGDAGFGDEEILNPQPVPLDRKYTEREVSAAYRYRPSRL